jgi:hypothetical protein
MIIKAYVADHMKKKSHLKKCIVCQSEFDYGKHKQTMTCSIECRKTYNQKNNEERVTKIKEAWVIKNGARTKKCATCSNDFDPGRHREKLNCSKECLKIYNDLHKKERMEKTFIAIKEKYGASSFPQTTGFSEKIKKIKKEKYSDENYNNFEKTKITNKEKYGVDTPMHKDDFIQKSKKSKKIKYGDENYNNRDKAKLTNLKNFNSEFPLQNKDVLEKMKQTNLERFGKEYSLLLDKTKENLKKYNLSHYSSEYYFGSATHIQTSITEKLNRIKEVLKENNLEFDYTLYKKLRSQDENGSLHYVTYPINCKICNSSFESHFKSTPICKTCYPKVSISKQQAEFKQFLIDNKIDFLEDTKKIIPPFQIDFVLPEFNIGIELNGNYFHSELGIGKKDSQYHLFKSMKANEQGMNLIHIFEDEWITKKDIIKSRILNMVNKTGNKIYARKCQIKEISSMDKNTFLLHNHLQGSDISSLNLGMFYMDKMVGVMTFSKPRRSLGYKTNSKNNNENIRELSRFCVLKDTNVVGGFSKFIEYFKKNYSEVHSLYTYADCRFSGVNPENTLYYKNNFTFIHRSDCSYFYMYKNDYLTRYHRFAFAKHTLIKKFNETDTSLTEWQIAQKNGLDRIWDCGSMKFELNLK